MRKAAKADKVGSSRNKNARQERNRDVGVTAKPQAKDPTKPTSAANKNISSGRYRMFERKKNHCPEKDCRYHSTRYHETVGDCRYLDITGHSKLGQMTAEQRRAYMKQQIQCPCYEAGPKPRYIKRNNDIFASKSVIDRKKDRTLERKYYSLGWSDYQIARAMGVSPTAIRMWRLREGLPATGPRKRKEETNETA